MDADQTATCGRRFWAVIKSKNGEITDVARWRLFGAKVEVEVELRGPDPPRRSSQADCASSEIASAYRTVVSEKFSCTGDWDCSPSR